MEIFVVELSGRTHHLTDLKPSDTVKDLYSHVHIAKQEDSAAGGYGVVAGDQILGLRDFSKELRSFGIKDGAMLTLVRVSQSEVYELDDRVGDEDETCAARSECRTVVRFAFTSESTCILIRQTHAQFMTGTFIWDICRGACTLSDDGNTVDCIWDHCHRRRRGGIETRGSFSIHDSGWVRREKIPESWKRLQLSGGSWKRQMAIFQERDSILGVRLGGQGNCAEALQILAL